MRTLVITQRLDEYSEWAATHGEVVLGYEFRDVEPIIRRREVDVVLFTGGEDVSPMLYGEIADYRTHYSQRRDWREVGIYRACEQAGVNTFGICRGAQFISVMRGATLHQHIEGHAISGTHVATLFAEDKDNKLPDVMRVNSTHHQAANMLTVRLAGGKLLYTAKAMIEGRESDVVEAAYWEVGLRKDYAVQWHPEYMGVHETARVVAGELLKRAGNEA